MNGERVLPLECAYRRLVSAVVGLATLCLAPSPRAFADERADSLEREVQMMDTNRDGTISADEHAAPGRCSR